MLVAGSVTVADDGSRTGDGLALARYDALLPIRVSTSTIDSLTDGRFVGGPAMIVAMKRALAAEVTATAAADIGYLVANTVVAVTTTIGTSSAFDGLQKTPNPNTADTDTKAPGSAKPLTGTGTIS